MLDRIDSSVDWPKVASILNGVHDSSEGRPAYSPITMIKVILLQQWNNLPDMDGEKMLRDRLSFRRFAGFTLHRRI